MQFFVFLKYLFTWANIFLHITWFPTDFQTNPVSDLGILQHYWQPERRKGKQFLTQFSHIQIFETFGYLEIDFSISKLLALSKFWRSF